MADNEFGLTIADLQRQADELQAQQREDSKQAIIDRLEAEKAALIAARDEEKTLAQKRNAEAALRIAKTAAAKAEQAASTAQQRIARARCIEEVGGNAKWNATPLSLRLEMQGVEGDLPKDAELRKVFGPDSTGNAAMELRNLSPKKYAAWKIIAREKNLIG